MTRPFALITNDDGIQSSFLHALIEGMRVNFDVAVAAPDSEKSWVSRGMTRHGKVRVEAREDFPFPAWAISGTPSDCVNIALGHLLDRTPDVVVSGINIGYNATETLVFSSGTVAGAMEASVWRLPALAASKWLPREVFEQVRAGVPGAAEVRASVRADGRRVSEFALGLVGKPCSDLVVHNLNFPMNSDADTPLVEARPAPLTLGSLFEKKPEGHYEFTYAQGQILDDSPDTDMALLTAGNVTYSRLNFSAVGRAEKN